MSPSLPAYRCVRCGISIYKPNAACRDCHSSDPIFVRRTT